MKTARIASNTARNPKHIHTSIRPHEGYRGLAYCYRGQSCCSFCEGDYKRTDGSFDVEGATRAAVILNTLALKRRRDMRDLAAHHDFQASKARALARDPFGT